MDLQRAISAWLDAAHSASIPAGSSVDICMQKAAAFLEGEVQKLPAWIGSDEADLLFAICQTLDKGDFAFGRLVDLYGVVSEADWESDGFDERASVLANLAYLAWNRSREEGNHDAMDHWRRRCRRHVLEQESSRDFLDLPVVSRSRDLTDRFLSDRCVLLAVAEMLAVSRNPRPEAAAEEAAATYEWLLRSGDMARDDYKHLAAECAYSAGVATKHMGRFDLSYQWSVKAAALYAQTRARDYYQAQPRFLQLCILYDRHDATSVIRNVEPVLADLEMRGPLQQALRCRLLQAVSLKGLGRLDESFALLQKLVRRLDRAPDDLLLGLAFINMGKSLQSAQMARRQSHTSARRRTTSANRPHRGPLLTFTFL